MSLLAQPADYALVDQPAHHNRSPQGTREAGRQDRSARGGEKSILAEEQPVIEFAYASVVTTAPIEKGQVFCRENLWVKRPGTGDFPASEYENILGKRATQDIAAEIQLAPSHVAAA